MIIGHQPLSPPDGLENGKSCTAKQNVCLGEDGAATYRACRAVRVAQSSPPPTQMAEQDEQRTGSDTSCQRAGAKSMVSSHQTRHSATFAGEATSASCGAESTPPKQEEVEF